MSSTATESAPESIAALSPLLLRERAGRVLMFLGTLEIVLFGLVTFAVTKAAAMSIDDLLVITGSNLTLDQLEAVHPHLRQFAIVLALSGIVPGAVFLICSAGLKRGLMLPAFVALILAATQLFALGGILLRQLLVAIAQGDPPAMTMNVLVLGTPMALLVFVIRVLLAATRK